MPGDCVSPAWVRATSSEGIFAVSILNENKRAGTAIKKMRKAVLVDFFIL